VTIADKIEWDQVSKHITSTFLYLVVNYSETLGPSGNSLDVMHLRISYSLVKMLQPKSS